MIFLAGIAHTQMHVVIFINILMTTYTNTSTYILACILCIHKTARPYVAVVSGFWRGCDYIINRQKKVLMKINIEVFCNFSNFTQFAIVRPKIQYLYACVGVCVHGLSIFSN